ncbi:polyphosphate kinase 2 family protein [Kamptonema cortianum]|nr:polyphosphate kinase 2 family protein [Geitlerinema splendidum]MDK3160948.1 polyphosphate kinase 2 family protein [Kamptonema cortianum]
MKSDFLVRSPGHFHLNIWPTDPNDAFEKEEIKEKTKELDEQVERLFDLLFFAGQHSLLVVLQGMDAAGKDGTIRHILKATHAQSARVASFGVPTEEELSRDFLWRCHKQVPGKGEICLFNRSHYEDVGVVRVHNLVAESIWSARYEQINQFESLLAQNSTIILKIWLHISSEEQEARLRERESEPDAAWKLNVNDWRERQHWDAYQQAYSDAISKCAAEHAPWLVVPANKKWYRNFVVSNAIVQTLSPYKQSWIDRLDRIGKEARAELEAFHASAQK